MSKVVERNEPLIDRVGRWFRDYHPELLRRLRHAARPGVSVEDALQDLWLAVLSTPLPAGVTEDPNRLRAWLWGVARRRFLDVTRREARRLQGSLGDPPTAGLDPSAVAEARESESDVHHVLTRLATGRSAVNVRLLELRYCDGLSLADIGRRFNMSPREVTVRLQRAKRKFRRAWAQRRGGGAEQR